MSIEPIHPSGLAQASAIGMGTAVARSGWAASGVKCKWAFAPACRCDGSCVRTGRVAKYALYSDADFTCRKCNEAGNPSTYHQCAAHVLRRENLQFYGVQPDQRTTGAPLIRSWKTSVRS